MFEWSRKIRGAGKARDPGTRILQFQGWLSHWLSLCATLGKFFACPAWASDEGLRRTQPLYYLQFWQSINLWLFKAFLSKPRLVNGECSAFEMQFVWERKKPSSYFGAVSEFYVLCEVINCVLASGLFQVASGFAEVAFSGIVPIAGKRVLICALAAPQGTLWQIPGSFFRGSADQWPCKMTHTLH